jgi:two-component system sensor histidine kinase RegB
MLDQQRANFAWLIQLRFCALAGQAVTIGVVALALGIDLPLVGLGAILAVELGGNLACVWRARRPAPIREGLVAGVMALDILYLTALLFLTGGPSNPFSVLYLVHIALGAVVLRPAWAWTVVGLSAGGFAALFAVRDADAHTEHMRLHLEGMWVAFALAAAFTVIFVTRVTHALAAREEELAQARDLTARHERVASLATLAAGAAHELATPLATIATAAKELVRGAENGEDALADAKLIREQVERCRTILRQMAADAGEEPGDASTPMAVRALVDASLDGLADAGRVRVVAERGDATARLPVHAVTQSLRALVKNALDATAAAGGSISLRCRVVDARLHVEVEDAGPGMPPEVLARAGEPFFTTKPPGRGMGLGLFVTRSTIERLGGRLVLESTPGAGTRAHVDLPIALEGSR